VRIRQIKPEFWEDPDIAELPRDIRLLFIGLWNMADEIGQLKDDARLIKRTLFGYDNDVTSVVIEDWLQQLEQHHQQFVVRRDGLLFIRTFQKHQRISGYENQKLQKRLKEKPKQEAQSSDLEANQKQQRSTTDNLFGTEIRSNGITEERNNGHTDPVCVRVDEKIADPLAQSFFSYFLEAKNPNLTNTSGIKVFIERVLRAARGGNKGKSDNHFLLAWQQTCDSASQAAPGSTKWYETTFLAKAKKEEGREKAKIPRQSPLEAWKSKGVIGVRLRGDDRIYGLSDLEAVNGLPGYLKIKGGQQQPVSSFELVMPEEAVS
jgi:hypothetical protein